MQPTQTATAGEAKIRQTVADKGMDWLVAAMVEGSIGYHSPQGARLIIRDYLAGGRRDWCERCLAGYGGDLEKMLLCDIEKFQYLEANMPGRAARILAYCQEVAKLSDLDQTGMGLMYPTLGF